MNQITRISPEIRDIHVPAPLRDLPLWCVWAYEQHEGEAKPRKIPQYSMGGRRYGEQGSPTDRAKLTTFAVARDAAAKRGLDGVGFALMDDAGIIALDFDNCVVDGKVDSVVLGLIQGTYSELSPSGKGVRAFFTGSADILGNPKSPTTADQFGTEIFSSKGFCTVTGHMLPHVDLVGLEDTIAPLPKKVIDFCVQRFGTSKPAAVDADDFMRGHEPVLGLSEERMTELLNQLDPDINRDAWIKVGMALHHETDGGEHGFGLWDGWSSNGFKYPSVEALRGQWDSFGGRAGRKQVTMASVIRMAKKRSGDATGVLERAQSIVAQSGSSTGSMSSPPDWQGKFSVISAGTAANAKPVEWLVKGVVPKADIFSIYGASGAGKSFVALDLAAAIARGTPWRGRKVKKGRVIIVAAEGGGGYGNRVRALANKLCIKPADLDIGLITAQPNILDQDDISELVAAILAVGEVDLIIIDTLAQVTPGANENTSEDMGKAISNLRIIRGACRATIGIVHHAGKDLSRGARGWSGLKGAMDAELEVNRNSDGDHREIVVKKQKDGRDGDVFPFRLETVLLGHDEDGDAISSCVVLECERLAKKPKGANQQIIYALVQEAGVSGIDREQLLDEACEEKKASEPESATKPQRDQTRSNLRGALTGSIRRGEFVSKGGRVFLPEFAGDADD